MTPWSGFPFCQQSRYSFLKHLFLIKLGKEFEDHDVIKFISAWVCSYPSQWQMGQAKQCRSVSLKIHFSSKTQKAISEFGYLCCYGQIHGDTDAEYRFLIYMGIHFELDCTDPFKCRGPLSVQTRAYLAIYYSQILCFKCY